MRFHLIKKNAFRLLLSLSVILSTGCASLFPPEMSCALRGKIYAGYHKIDATVTDATHYETIREEIHPAQKYAHYCRPPETQAERVEVNTLKPYAQEMHTHQLIEILSGTVVGVAIVGLFFWWWAE